jgi:group I intron endonuclease
MGIIYEALNLTNHKRYICQTIRTLDERIEAHYYDAKRPHRKHFVFYRAIRKYGPDNFRWRVIGNCKTKRQLDEAERACIDLYCTNNKLYGYNNTPGGTGGAIRKGMKASKVTKKKMSESAKKRKISDEYRESARRSMLGRKLSIETRRKMSEARKGKQNALGHRHSEETKRKMSEAHKKRL